MVIPAVRSCVAHALTALSSDRALPGKELRSRLQAMAPDHGKDLPAEFRAWGFDLAGLSSGG